MASVEIQQLREVIGVLEETVIKLDNKNKIQKELFSEYIRIFHKLSQKLALLSNKINEQILIDEGMQSLYCRSPKLKYLQCFPAP